MLKKNYILFYLLILSMIFIQCQCGDGPTEPPPDTTAPRVIKISPTPATSSVPLNTSVTVIFSEKIQPLINGITYITIPNTTFSTTFTDTSITASFSTLLQYETDYTVTVTTSVADLAGNSLDSNYTWTFTTTINPVNIPPSIISQYPQYSGSIINKVTDSVAMTFSKDMDTTTINSTSFRVASGRPGVYGYISETRTAYFKSTVPFGYDSTYNVTVETSIKDTDGNNLDIKRTLTFHTPTVTPIASFVLPDDSTIIGDTATFTLVTSNPIGIDSVQYFVDDLRVGVDNTNLASELSTFVVDASIYPIGTEHTLHAIAYDSLGNFGYSDSTQFFYLWQEVYVEGNDTYSQLEIPNDLRKMFIRSKETTLELRYEYGFTWESAYSDTSCLRVYDCGLGLDTVFCSDTAVDLGIYFDTDLNPGTGRLDGGGAILNGIGADYRIILGLHGGFKALSMWNPSSPQWDTLGWIQIYDTLGFTNHNIPQNSKIMEIGLLWSDLGNPAVVNIVNVNVFFRNFCSPDDFLPDFMPDQGNGHVRVVKENRYIGPLPSSNFKTSINRNSLSIDKQNHYENPFE